jgi:hypothetical protein
MLQSNERVFSKAPQRAPKKGKSVANGICFSRDEKSEASPIKNGSVRIVASNKAPRIAMSLSNHICNNHMGEPFPKRPKESKERCEWEVRRGRGRVGGITNQKWQRPNRRFPRSASHVQYPFLTPIKDGSVRVATSNDASRICNGSFPTQICRFRILDAKTVLSITTLTCNSDMGEYVRKKGRSITNERCNIKDNESDA